MIQSLVVLTLGHARLYTDRPTDGSARARRKRHARYHCRRRRQSTMDERVASTSASTSTSKSSVTAAVRASLSERADVVSTPASIADAGRMQTEPKNASTHHVSAYDHAIAGQIAGMVGLTLVHPLDTVKARLQAATPLATVRGASTGGFGMVGTLGGYQQRETAMCVARNLLAQDGARGLYRGLTAPMLAYGAINAVAFATNASVRDAIEDRFGKEVASGTVAGAFSGALAGLTSSFVRGPAERLKTVQQVVDCESGRYRSALSTAMTLTREHGVMKGIFTGTGATIAREIPQCAVYFLTYDTMKTACVHAFCGENVDVRDAAPSARAAAIVLAGGSAGAFQWLLTYPLDVTKSRIQAAKPGTYSGVLDCAVKSVSAEGPMVLFRGLNMALLRAFPLHASIFASCEAVHSVLARIRGNEPPM